MLKKLLPEAILAFALAIVLMTGQRTVHATAVTAPAKAVQTSATVCPACPACPATVTKTAAIEKTSMKEDHESTMCTDCPADQAAHCPYAHQYRRAKIAEK